MVSVCYCGDVGGLCRLLWFERVLLLSYVEFLEKCSLKFKNG